MKLRLSWFYLALLVASTVPVVAQGLPDFRPAVPGNHRNSLVNLINAQSLMARGQKDGIVMFETGITELGESFNSRCYRGSANTEMLQKEVLGELDRAQFDAAVYNHTHVVCYLQGTVMFLIHDGKPMIRVFLNQEDSEIKAGHDFIAPQYCFATGNTAFRNYWMAMPPGGVALLGLDVDAKGHVTGKKVLYEHPPGQNFGGIMAGHIGEALFVPGFRNGQATACHFNWTAVFTGPGKRAKTG